MSIALLICSVLLSLYFGGGGRKVKVNDGHAGYIKLKRAEKFILSVGRYEEKIFKKRTDIRDRKLKWILEHLKSEADSLEQRQGLEVNETDINEDQGGNDLQTKSSSEVQQEQRGKMKEEEFVKKLQEMMMEEEKQRIPIAQGLPWTTDEPECLKKPPIKEITQPIDLKLHSDVRAVERAEFDHQVFEKLTMIEQYKMEREMQQKLEEEEEIRILRRELVPKAQPMPYFDRPFVPRRSSKQPTIPKEPRFQFPQQKKIKCSLSWSDLNDYIHAS